MRTVDSPSGDIIVTWKPPAISCAYGQPGLSYKVYWKKAELRPPNHKGTLLKDCGAACSCAFGSLRGTASFVPSTSCSAGALLSLTAANSSLRLRFGLQTDDSQRQASFFDQALLAAGIPTCSRSRETGNLSTSVGCCRQDLAVQLGLFYFNDSGIMNGARTARTMHLNFTIPRSSLDDFSVYMISVGSWWGFFLGCDCGYWCHFKESRCLVRVRG